MGVSIVIVSYNVREYLRRCLTSIYEHTRGVDFEVIVVDNASTDETAQMVASMFPQAQLASCATNAGFAAGANRGIACAHRDCFFLLNPDSETTTNVLPSMLAYLHANDDIGILAPKLIDADGTLQLSCRAFPTFGTALFNRYSLGTKLLRNNRRSRRYLMTDFDHNRTADVDWVSGACWLMRRRAYETVGPLDETYFWSIEDVDYCQRTHRAGLRVVYFPDATIVHHIGRSAAAVPVRSTVARHLGMWHYYRTYLRPDTPVVRQAINTIVLGGIAVRAAAQLMANGVSQVLRRTKRGRDRSVAVERL